MAKRLFKKSGAEYAKQFGCDPRTIRNWKAKGYPLDDLDAMEEIVAGQHRGPDGDSTKEIDINSEPTTMEAAKLHRILWQIRKARVEVEERKRVLVLKSEVITDISRISSMLTATLLSMGPELAGQLVGKTEGEIKRAIEQRERAACQQWADEANAIYS